MRKIILALLLIPIILVALLVLAFMNVNRLLDDRRDELAVLASDAVGREVTFDNAEVAFPGRLSIRIDGLRIAEDPAFGNADFLALDSAYVAVDLLPALQRRIEIKGVRLDNPTIRVIQTSKGYNFSTLGAKSNGAGEGDGAVAEEGAPMALAIAGFLINDATIVYEDRTSKPALSVTVENFQSRASDLFREGPVEIGFTGDARPTKGSPELASAIEGDIVMQDLAARTGHVRLQSPSFHPLLLGLDFEEGSAVERLDGVDLNVDLPAKASEVGYPITLTSSGGRLAGFDFDGLDTKIVYRGSKVDIQNLVIGLVGGNVALDGDLTLGKPGRSPFNLKTKLTDLDSDQLAHILLGTPTGSVSGTVGGDVNLTGKSLDWETLKRSLAGQIDLHVGEGALEGINVVDQIVNRLLADPLLGPMAATAIRDVIPQALQGDRTVFNNVNMAFDIANGAVQADQLELMAGDFMISAVGALGFDGAVAGDGKIRFPEEISKKIYAKADRFAPLLGDGTIVELPLLLGGLVSSPSVQPNLAALASLARANATDELKQEAGGRLLKAIFGDNVEPPDSANTDPEAAGKANQQKAAEQLIQRGLGQLFGGDNRGGDGDGGGGGGDDSAAGGE